MINPAGFHIDQYKLIVQTDGDGGDSAARTGLYYFLLSFKEIYLFPCFIRFINVVQLSPGVFIRHPVKWNDPKDFSRDQENPIVMVCSFYPEIHLLKEMLWNRIKRFSRFQNGDLSGPHDYAMIFRSLRWWPLYPFFIFSDLFLLLNSVIICFWKAREPGPILTWLGKYHWFFVADSPPNPYGVPQDVHGLGNVGSDINHCMSLMQAYKIYPTPVSYFARKIYSTFRPGGIQKAWDIYFDPKTGANPFNMLAAQIIEGVFE